MKTSQEQLKEIITSLIDTIDTVNGSWVKPWGTTFPHNYTTGREYNGINVWILWAIAQKNKYPTNQWLSFQQVTQAGGRINRGEKSTPVFFFKPLQIKEIDENGNEELKTIPLLKSFNVFNISQTDLKIDTTETDLIPDIENFIFNCDIEIIQDTFAYYLPSRHVIGMPHKDSFKSSEAYYSTLLHELAHSTGGALERDLTGKFGSPSYRVEELIAETTKTMLASAFGIEHTDSEEFKQSAKYIKSWLKGAEPKELFKIFSEAQKAFNYLMDRAVKEEIAA